MESLGLIAKTVNERSKKPAAAMESDFAKFNSVIQTLHGNSEDCHREVWENAYLYVRTRNR